MSSKSTFEKNLRAAAQRLPRESVPETLSARVISALPDKAPARPTAKWIPRLAVVGALTGVTIAGGYFLPRTVITTSYAASMKQAIASAKTWHFTGWRLVDGKRVRWEVWGRRTPFLYREQIGGELLIDDGKERVHILPPDKFMKTAGTCLITPSEPLHSMNTPFANGRRMTAGFLAGISSEASNFDTFDKVPNNPSVLKAETRVDIGTDPPIRERAVLLVDSQTHLPTRYSVLQETHKKHPQGTGKTLEEMPLDGTPLSVQTMSELTPEYDVPVADTVAQYIKPAGYKIIDATKTKADQAADGSVCTRKGLTLQAHIVGRDREGNLHLRFEGWLAGEPIRQRTQGFLLMLQPVSSTRASSFEGTETDPTANTDNAGNKYLQFSQPPWTTTNAEQPELWMTPVEPILPQTAPTKVHLLVKADLSRYERISDTGRKVPVLEDTFEFDLQLPAASGTLGWNETPTTPQVIFSGVLPTLRMKTAQARVYDYIGRSFATTTTFPDGHQVSIVHKAEENKKRALHWLAVVEQEARRTNNRQMLDLARQNRESLLKR